MSTSLTQPLLQGSNAFSINRGTEATSFHTRKGSDDSAKVEGFDLESFNKITAPFTQEGTNYTDEERKQIFELKRDCDANDIWYSKDYTYMVALESSEINLWQIQPAVLKTKFSRSLEPEDKKSKKERPKEEERYYNHFAISLDEKMLVMQFDKELLKAEPEDEDDTNTVNYISVVWIQSLANLFDPSFPLLDLIRKHEVRIDQQFK